MKNRTENKTTYLTKIIAGLCIIQVTIIDVLFMVKLFLDEYTQTVSLAGHGISIILAFLVIGLTVKDAKDNHISKTISVIVMQIIIIALLIIAILKTTGMLF